MFYVYAYVRSTSSETAKSGLLYYIGKGKDKISAAQKGIPKPKFKCPHAIKKHRLQD